FGGVGRFSVSRLLPRIVDMRLEQELVGLLEEELLRRLIAEAIGPAAIDGRDRAIGLDVLAEGKPHHAVAIEGARAEAWVFVALASRKPHHALAIELGIGRGGFVGFGVASARRKAR